MTNSGDAGTIASSSSAADACLSNSKRADGGSVLTQCPLKVTVAIRLNPAVACPGHPLAINAVGTPDGGTYRWTVSGAELVDDSGNAVSSGATVNLRAFQPDNGTGSIPERVTTVGVTYTHPTGTAQDSKSVKIHKITFKVSGKQEPEFDDLQAKEDEYGVQIGQADPNIATMKFNPEVTITIDSSCPHKHDCAGNHCVGWLQDVTEATMGSTWQHTVGTGEFKVGPPIRDATKDSEFPFYDKSFTFHLDVEGDSDMEVAYHDDSPGWPSSFDDPKNPVPDKSLQTVTFRKTFRAWLVVQNIEWSQHDLRGSFAYLKNFKWWVSHDLQVDAKQPVGSRCKPKRSKPHFDPPVGDGMGAASPSLTKEIANDATHVNYTPTGPPSRLKHHK